MEHVIGTSGAAAMYSRAFVEDVKIAGEFFDELFFAYREDADLAWRARLFAWECIYAPRSVAYHMRRVPPAVGSRVAPEIKRPLVRHPVFMSIKDINSRGSCRLVMCT